MKHLLNIALDWAKRSFGDEQMKNPGTRALRVHEESAELCQSVHVPLELVLQDVRDVYARPPGDPAQEIGGVLMTIYLFVRSLGWMYGSGSPAYFFATELRRVLAKPPKHFTDRNAQKIEVPMQSPVGVPGADDPGGGE